MAETFCIMIQGLTFGKSPTTNCLLVNLSTFIYCLKKKNKTKNKNKKNLEQNFCWYFHLFFSQRVRGRMLQSYCFLARFVFPGNAFVSRQVHPYLRCHFSSHFSGWAVFKAKTSVRTSSRQSTNQSSLFSPSNHFGWQKNIGFETNLYKQVSWNRLTGGLKPAWKFKTWGIWLQLN